MCVCSDEEAFSSVNAHGDSSTQISQASLESDIFPALSTCLAHAAELPSVDLQHLGVEADCLTGDDSDSAHHAVFLGCLLYASVHSAQRSDFIGRIMALDQATQQQLMGTIQTITTALKDTAVSDDEGDEQHITSEDTASLAALRAQVRDLMLQNVRALPAHVPCRRQPPPPFCRRTSPKPTSTSKQRLMLVLALQVHPMEVPRAQLGLPWAAPMRRRCCRTCG